MWYQPKKYYTCLKIPRNSPNFESVKDEKVKSKKVKAKAKAVLYCVPGVIM